MGIKPHCQVSVGFLGDFLCAGSWAELESLNWSLNKIDDIQSTIARGGTRSQLLESRGKDVGRGCRLGVKS